MSQGTVNTTTPPLIDVCSDASITMTFTMAPTNVDLGASSQKAASGQDNVVSGTTIDPAGHNEGFCFPHPYCPSATT